MKGVDTISRIRREFFVRGRSIKEIVRDLHVSRNTVRKVLRTGATEFRYERGRQALPKLGPWRDALDALLVANEGKAARERLTLIRLFETLRGPPMHYLADPPEHRHRGSTFDADRGSTFDAD